MKRWMKVVIPVAAVAILLGWYAFRPERLVVNRHVDEALPTAQAGSSPQPIAAGQFYSILHPTAGTATVYQMGDGTRVLRFTGFSTSNGPDVHVYMVAADDAKDIATVEKSGFIDLGVIKGNIGDQNYTLAGDLDLAKYRAVSIWCKRFSVNFGTAPLRPTEASSINPGPVGRHPSRSCVCALEARSSMPRKFTRKPKWPAASSGIWTRPAR
jgi:hypothetical protein